MQSTSCVFTPQTAVGVLGAGMGSSNPPSPSPSPDHDASNVVTGLVDSMPRALVSEHDEDGEMSDHNSLSVSTDLVSAEEGVCRVSFCT